MGNLPLGQDIDAFHKVTQLHVILRHSSVTSVTVGAYIRRLEVDCTYSIV